MPTGYTADVQDGKVTTLREFALLCARGFGATIMMRDDPMEKAIPERFEPQTKYHDDNIIKSRAILAELPGLSGAECERRAIAKHADKLDSHRRYAANKEQARQRYETMRAHVEAWQVPDEIAELRKFMIEQLNSSIDFDCSTKYQSEEPQLQSGEAWRSATIAQAARDLAYHSEERQKEIERTEGRNHWIATLRTALETA